MPSTRSRTRPRTESSRLAALRARWADDTGAAIAEFAMISVLLVFLLFAVLQVALLFYVRTVVASSAADGARFAGAADVPTVDGATRATSLIASGLDRDVAAQVQRMATDQADADSGRATIEVRSCAHAGGRGSRDVGGATTDLRRRNGARPGPARLLRHVRAVP